MEKKIKRYTAELEELRSRDTSFPNVIGKSKGIQESLELVNKAADFDANVLLNGGM
jgi:transcriptional regulator with PAS, ATPase and Fis domain